MVSIQYALNQPIDDHDVGDIKRRLDEIPGIKSVALNKQRRILCVDYDDTATSEKEIHQRLHDLRYPVIFIDSISF